MSTKISNRISVNDLLDAGLHFGHQTKRWNPKMKRYIHGAKNGIYIIDLNKTLSQLDLAIAFLNDVVLRGEKFFLLVQKNKQEKYLNLLRNIHPNHMLFIGG